MLADISSFALIAPIFILLLGITQIGGWFTWSKQTELLSAGFSFIFASLGMLVQIAGWQEPFWTRVLAFSIFYSLAASFAGMAVAQRFKIRTYWPWLLGIGLILIAIELWFTVVHPSFLVRVYALSLGAMVLIGMPLIQYRQINLSNKFDRYLLWLLVFFIIANIVRTLLQLPIVSFQEYEYKDGSFIQTYFWLFLYILLMTVCTCYAVFMLSAVIKDVFSQLTRERSQDFLTKIYNRWGFEELIQRAFSVPKPNLAKYSGAIILCDIDHFKSINDNWGHATGDEVLKLVAKVLKKHSREEDLVARIGGEEFAIFMQHVDIRQAAAIAQRMCDAVSNMHFPMLDGQQVTISIGVAIIDSPNAAVLDAALHMADQNLYSAKKSGRNLVVYQDTGNPSESSNAS